MKIVTKNYSFVIIGNSHNPTVISDSFLLKSGIVSDLSEIDRNNFLITPGFCQVLFLKNNTSFIVEPNSLKISSSDSRIPFEMGYKYCSSLGYIKSMAVGINFDILVEDYDFIKWFIPLTLSEYRECVTNSIVFSFKSSQTSKSNVNVTKIDDSKAIFRFNYHTDTKDVILSELNSDFVLASEEYMVQSVEFINSIL